MKAFFYFFTLLSISCTLFAQDKISSSIDQLSHFFELNKSLEAKLIYIADSNHSNEKMKKAMSIIIEQIVKQDKEIDCLLLESDKMIYQQAIDQFTSGQLPWEESVGAADLKWEQLTGRSYKQSKVIFEQAVKLGLKIYAVDWDDSSSESKRMKILFNEGFKKGKKDSLIAGFQLGVTSRNKAMAAHISEVMALGLHSTKKLCKKAIMTVGSLHLMPEADMSTLGIGVQKFKTISDFLPSELKQETLGVYDCINMVNAQEASEACKANKMVFDKLETPSSEVELFTTTESLPLRAKPASMGAVLLFYKD